MSRDRTFKRNFVTVRRRLLLLALLLLPAVAVPAADRPVVEIRRVASPPQLDDFLSMRPGPESTEGLVRVEGFVQQKPEDGRPASQRTEVYLGYDSRNLYVVFVAHDDDPEKIRAHMARRENMFGDEIVEIMLDTFGDGQRAYAFVVNPLGVQWDAIWTEGSGFDDSWDTVWQSRGRLTDTGYVVSMVIPFRSLRFPKGAGNDWRVILVRDVPRNNESSFWPPVSSRVEGRLNQAATLRGLAGISPGHNIQLIPYVSSRSYRVLNEDGSGFVRERLDADAGLDAKFVFRDSLALDVTANPDFSQVESDQPQVTVNERFEVFYPEKRPFFLENADFFRTPMNLLFTRRIEDPRAGVRLTGKAGSFAVGGLLIDDERPGDEADPGTPEHGEQARFSVIRVSRELPRQSHIGIIYTDREFEGSTNRVGGIDGRFKLDDNWDARFQAVDSSTRTLEGVRLDDSAFDLSVNRSGRKFNTHIHYQDIGKEFRTEAGFVPRPDVRVAHQSTRYSFRPEGPRLISFTPQLFVEHIADQSGTRLDWSVRPEIEWELRRQTEFEVFARWGRERLRPEDTVVPILEPLDFSRRTQGFGFDTKFIRSLSVEGRLEFGRGINLRPARAAEGEKIIPPSPADQLRAELGLTLRPGRRLRMDATWLHAQLDTPDDGRRILTNDIVRTRFDWQFDPRLSLRMILQYEAVTRDPGLTSVDTPETYSGDLLVTYLINPWTALYVGYVSGYENWRVVESPNGPDLVRTDGDFLNDSRELFVKFSYLFRP